MYFVAWYQLSTPFKTNLTFPSSERQAPPFIETVSKPKNKTFLFTNPRFYKTEFNFQSLGLGKRIARQGLILEDYILLYLDAKLNSYLFVTIKFWTALPALKLMRTEN